MLPIICLSYLNFRNTFREITGPPISTHHSLQSTKLCHYYENVPEPQLGLEHCALDTVQTQPKLHLSKTTKHQQYKQMRQAKDVTDTENCGVMQESWHVSVQVVLLPACFFPCSTLHLSDISFLQHCSLSQYLCVTRSSTKGSQKVTAKTEALYLII